MHEQFCQDASNELFRFTEKEAAKFLNISVSFLQKSRINGREDIVKGRAPDFVDIDGGIWYYLDDLQIFLKQARFGCRLHTEINVVDIVLLTEEQTAVKLGKSLSWLQKSRGKKGNLIKLGKAPAFYKIGGAVRYAQHDIDVYNSSSIHSRTKRHAHSERILDCRQDAANDAFNGNVWASWLAPELVTM